MAGTRANQWLTASSVASLRAAGECSAPRIGDSAEAVVRTILDAIPAVPAVRGPIALRVCLATYVDGQGQPYAGQLGPYAALGEIPLLASLRHALTGRVGGDVDLMVVHDGWAALAGARLVHPHTDAAVMLGTAIGSGPDPR